MVLDVPVLQLILMCLNIGTPKNISFKFWTNKTLMILGENWKINDLR